MKLHTAQKNIAKEKVYQIEIRIIEDNNDLLRSWKVGTDYKGVSRLLRQSKNNFEKHLKKLSTEEQNVETEPKKNSRFIQTSIDIDYKPEEIVT